MNDTTSTGADNSKAAWEQSYSNRDNFVFFPHEEVIRFVSRYIRKRVGLDEYRDIDPQESSRTILDLGCGIGRHVLYCHSMGLEAYGIDLSETALSTARQWAASTGAEALADRFKQGDIRRLPWADGFFRYAVSHGVLDSMPYAVASAACIELARVMQPRGLFYCDLVSGDDSKHAREFCGDEVVTTAHESGTTQSYFNFERIRRLFEGKFEIAECTLIRRENVQSGGYSSRYHVVLRRL